MRTLLMASALALVGVALPVRVRADVSHVIHTRSDDRGGGAHVAPLWNDQVRMAAERVVLVPYYEPGKYQPRLMVHVWYDLVNEGKATRLPVGFPELRAAYQEQVRRNMGPVAMLDKAYVRVTMPTILAFTARQGARVLPVQSYPGLGDYRRWLAFGLDLAAGQRVRLHTTYTATLGRSTFAMDQETAEDPREIIDYFLHYVLHTGARWRGAIGSGEIFVYADGRLRLLRRWKDLEPTVKDDVNLSLDILSERPRTEPPEELGPGERGYRTPAGNRLDLRRLLYASSTLASGEVDTHVGLVVDGDPETAWVSGKGQGTGATLHLPADPKADLVGLRVVSGTPGAGRGRPAKVVVRCQAGWRKLEVARASLPDGPGPHAVALAKPARCHAILLEIQQVHGPMGAPVAIAEVEQRYGGADAGSIIAKGPNREDPWRAIRAALAKSKGRPAAADPRAFEVAGIEDVSWSADGSLVHYRLHLEDQLGPRRGARLGYFVEVATGKAIRAYRLDREGALPEPYERHWVEAMSYEEGTALLAKHGFQPSKAARWAPRQSTLKGQLLALKGTLKGEDDALAVRPAAQGFTWRYLPKTYTRTGMAEVSLALRYREKGKPEQALVTHGSRIDRAFAGKHATVWQARKKIFAEAAQEWVKGLEQVGLETKVKPEDAAVWHLATYRYWPAYRGEAQVYWHPKGEALLVVWSDHQDLSSLWPDPEPGEAVPECAELEWKVCPWDRRDDDRERVAVTVHAFVPRAPTTLLAPYRPPPPAPKPEVAAKGRAPQPAAMAKGSPVAEPGEAPARKKSGCGCVASSGGTGSLPLAPFGLILLVALAGWRRRRAQTVAARRS